PPVSIPLAPIKGAPVGITDATPGEKPREAPKLLMPEVMLDPMPLVQLLGIRLLRKLKLPIPRLDPAEVEPDATAPAAPEMPNIPGVDPTIWVTIGSTIFCSASVMATFSAKRLAPFSAASHIFSKIDFPLL